MRRVGLGALGAIVVLVGAVGGAILLLDRNTASEPRARAVDPVKAREAQTLHASPDLVQPAVRDPSLVRPLKAAHLSPLYPASAPLQIALKKPPRAGILFDMETGEVLWSENPMRQLPIASLTKMMTGLLIAERHSAQERVLISAKASKTPGSRIGVLKPGHRVPLGPLLEGLMMVSGNDAAVALAEHDAGTTPAFLAEMNAAAKELGLTCTHFTTPNGLRDHGNYSCADDLATLARLDLANPTLRGIVGRRDASPAFPTKGGKLDLTTHNPFILLRVPGVTGLKTGYTAKAGRCYVVTERHAGRYLGVVLLHSPNPLRTIPQLLKAGFTAPR